MNSETHSNRKKPAPSQQLSVHTHTVSTDYSLHVVALAFVSLFVACGDVRPLRQWVHWRQWILGATKASVRDHPEAEQCTAHLQEDGV